MGHLRHPNGQGRGFCRQTTQVLRGNPKGAWLLLSSATKSMPKPADVPWDGLSSSGRAQNVGCKGKKKQNNSPITCSKGSRWAPEEAAGKKQELPVRMKHHQDRAPSELQGPGIPTHFLGNSQCFRSQLCQTFWGCKEGLVEDGASKRDFPKKTLAKGVLEKGFCQKGL